MTVRKTIYIAGPMTGKPDLNYPRFRRFAKLLRDEGWKVVSPVEMAEDNNWTPDMLTANTDLLQRLIFAELEAVKCCDAILMLKGWEESKGARTELLVALTHNKEVIQERDYVGHGDRYETRKEVA